MSLHKLGILDDDFIRGGIPMTKREVRMAVLSEANLQADSRVLDVGAGTGSISVEAALLAPKGKVWAIEREDEGAELIQQNSEKFGVKNLEVIKGLAPDAMGQISEELDAVIIGGSGGNLEDILDVSGKLLKVGGRIIVTGVTTGTTDRAAKYFQANKQNYRFWGYQVAVTRLRPAGAHFLFQALNPIFILVGEKTELQNLQNF